MSSPTFLMQQVNRLHNQRLLPPEDPVYLQEDLEMVYASRKTEVARLNDADITFEALQAQLLEFKLHLIEQSDVVHPLIRLTQQILAYPPVTPSGWNPQAVEYRELYREAGQLFIEHLVAVIQSHDQAAREDQTDAS